MNDKRALRAAAQAVARAAVLTVVLAACATGCQAAALRYCDPPATLSAVQKDQLLRFGAIVKDELERSGQGLALISRSGLDLSRFGQRYSHTGFSLKDSTNAPWSVRQLYYACEERRPRLFDQGMAGFVLGADDPAASHVSLVFLPEERAAGLARTVLDNRLALQLLGSTYSANAYPFALRYQNCNQWVMELLAIAWGAPAEAAASQQASPPEAPEQTRERAQAWLKAQAYAPTRFEVASRMLMFAGGFVPWLHSDDHPPEDLEQMVYQVSMPASIEAFVRAHVPGATRVELCRSARHIVVHRGWTPIAEGCRPGADDSVVALD